MNKDASSPEKSPEKSHNYSLPDVGHVNLGVPRCLTLVSCVLMCTDP